jgi:hypothetical protein
VCRVWWLPNLRWVLYTAVVVSVLWLRGQPHSELRDSIEWKEAKAALAKRSPEGVRKSAATSHSAAPKAQRAGPSAEQTDLGGGWNHVVRGGRVVKDTTTSPHNPKPSPQPVTEAPSQHKVSANRNTAGLKKPKPKSTAATKPTAGKTMKKAAASVKTAAAKPRTPDLVLPTQSSTSPLEEISDLGHLPIQACVELTRRLLTSISSLPAGAASPRAVLKTVILFVAEYGSMP